MHIVKSSYHMEPINDTYDVFVHKIIECIKNKYNIHNITFMNYMDCVNKIEKIVTKKIPNDIDYQFIIFKNIHHRNMEIHTGDDKIDDTFLKIITYGVVADILHILGYDSYYQKNLK